MTTRGRNECADKGHGRGDIESTDQDGWKTFYKSEDMQFNLVNIEEDYNFLLPPFHFYLFIYEQGVRYVF